MALYTEIFEDLKAMKLCKGFEDYEIEDEEFKIIKILGVISEDILFYVLLGMMNKEVFRSHPLTAIHLIDSLYSAYRLGQERLERFEMSLTSPGTNHVNEEMIETFIFMFAFQFDACFFHVAFPSKEKQNYPWLDLVKMSKSWTQAKGLVIKNITESPNIILRSSYYRDSAILTTVVIKKLYRRKSYSEIIRIKKATELIYTSRRENV